MTDTGESLDEFLARARSWFDGHATRRPPDGSREWGTGSDSVALFQNLSHEEEKALIDARRRWIQEKADAGFANERAFWLA